VAARALRELVADEIVNRERTGRIPAPVRYSVTEYRRSLTPILEKVRHWGRGHIRRFGD
jgi:DNA-binding HxlR family transcriptional regulator